MRETALPGDRQIWMTALTAVWWIVSLLTIALLVLSFAGPDDLLLRSSPVCTSLSRYQAECWFCGMTRAFLAIGNLDFSDAWSLNRLSIPLFLGLGVNSLFYLFSLFRIIRHTIHTNTIFTDIKRCT